MAERRARVGIMGGTFNPIHIGHLGIARQALTRADLDEIWFIPTGDPPHKRHDLANASDRLEMVRLAVKDEARFVACSIEVDRPGRTYTVDTLRALHRRHPNTDFFYLIGSDTLMDLVTWREIGEVAKLCAFLVFWRPGTPRTWVEAARADIEARFGGTVQIMPALEQDISSTDIRRRASLSLSLAEMVPEPVEKYIRMYALYTPRIPEVPS